MCYVHNTSVLELLCNLVLSQFLECGPEEEAKIDVKSSNTITRRFPSHTVTHFQKQTLDLPTKDEEMLYITQAAC
jgi:hypothetical protein